MPRFKRIYRAETTDMQGEGSWIEFTSPKVGEIRAIQAADSVEDYEQALDMLRTNIVAWNWADEADEPLPLPRDDVDVLATDEVAYLIQVLVRAKASDLKN